MFVCSVDLVIFIYSSSTLGKRIKSPLCCHESCSLIPSQLMSFLSLFFFFFLINASSIVCVSTPCAQLELGKKTNKNVYKKYMCSSL